MDMSKRRSMINLQRPIKSRIPIKQTSVSTKAQSVLNLSKLQYNLNEMESSYLDESESYVEEIVKVDVGTCTDPDPEFEDSLYQKSYCTTKISPFHENNSNFSTGPIFYYTVATAVAGDLHFCSACHAVFFMEMLAKQHCETEHY